MEAVEMEEIPVHLIHADALDERLSTEECPLFTVKELEKAALSMKDRKEPGAMIAKC